jgi:hypothetical protein
VLSDLEKANPRRRLTRGTDSKQLQLFAAAAVSPLEEDLRKLNIDRLTPLDALSKLAELKKRLEVEQKR